MVFHLTFHLFSPNSFKQDVNALKKRQGIGELRTIKFY